MLLSLLVYCRAMVAYSMLLPYVLPTDGFGGQAGYATVTWRRCVAVAVLSDCV